MQALLVVYAVGFMATAVLVYRWLGEEDLNGPGDGMLRATAAAWIAWAWPLVAAWLAAKRLRGHTNA